MKKNKNLLFAGLIVLAVVATFLIYQGCEKKDNVKFMEEYPSVGEDNVFTYRSIDEIIKIMENGTGVVYLGFPECPWCQSYVKYLNEVAKEVGIDKIYYYNIFVDRLNNTSEYRKILNILGDKLQFDEEGNYRLYVPCVSFHDKGQIIGINYETSLDTHGLNSPEEYWTAEEVRELKADLKGYMQQVYDILNTCTDCNK